MKIPMASPTIRKVGQRREVSRLQEEDATAKPALSMAWAMERLMLEADGKVNGARLAEAVRVALEK